MVDSLLAVPLPETSALLAAVAALSGDEVLRRRVHRAITDRADAPPRWLADLHRTTALPRAVEVTHTLGDGDNVLVAAAATSSLPELRCGLATLLTERLRIAAKGGVNATTKVLALVAGMICGADSISDMDLLRHGGMPRLFTDLRASSTRWKRSPRTWR